MKSPNVVDYCSCITILFCSIFWLQRSEAASGDLPSNLKCFTESTVKITCSWSQPINIPSVKWYIFRVQESNSQRAVLSTRVRYTNHSFKLMTLNQHISYNVKVCARTKKRLWPFAIFRLTLVAATTSTVHFSSAVHNVQSSSRLFSPLSTIYPPSLDMTSELRTMTVDVKSSGMMERSLSTRRPTSENSHFVSKSYVVICTSYWLPTSSDLSATVGLASLSNTVIANILLVDSASISSHTSVIASKSLVDSLSIIPSSVITNSSLVDSASMSSSASLTASRFLVDLSSILPSPTSVISKGFLVNDTANSNGNSSTFSTSTAPVTVSQSMCSDHTPTSTILKSSKLFLEDKQIVLIIISSMGGIIAILIILLIVILKLYLKQRHTVHFKTGLDSERYVGSSSNTMKSEYFNVDVEGRYAMVALENCTSNLGYLSVSTQSSSLSVDDTYEEVR